MKIQPHTDEDLKCIARDLLGGIIFSDRHLSEQDNIGSHFLPIGLGSLSSLSKEEVSQIGMAYEYLDKQGPRSVNGKPVFMSVRYLSVAQVEKVAEYMDKIDKAIKDIT